MIDWYCKMLYTKNVKRAKIFARVSVKNTLHYQNLSKSKTVDITKPTNYRVHYIKNHKR